VAFLLGCQSGAKVSRYERFSRQPNLETILACEVVFGAPVRDLLAGTFQKVEDSTLERARLLAEKLSTQEPGRITDRKTGGFEGDGWHARSRVRQHTMKQVHSHYFRILAIDPCTRGFGFALLEGSKNLIDWGVQEVAGDKNTQCLKRIGDLIEQYAPDIIVVENYAGKSSSRCRRVEELIENSRTLASATNTESHSFSRSEVRQAFSQFDAFTKHQIAMVIGSQFPELASRVPPFRKCWMPEDYRISILDAVALGLTFFHFDNSQEQAA